MNINFIQILGLSIIIVVVLKSLRLIFSSFKLNGKKNSDNTAFTKEITQARNQFNINQNFRNVAWKGFREFVIINKVDEGGHVYSYYLEPSDQKAFPSYLPGQYLTFSLNVPGQTEPIIRCYSLSDTPLHDDCYRVSIKRILPSENRPHVKPGLVSNYFFEHLNESDTVHIKVPAGKFTLNPDMHTPVVMIAGGIGITPLLSMLNTVFEAGSKRPVYFLYAVTNSTEHIMKKHLAYIAANCPHIHLHIFYASPLPTDEPGKDYQHLGFVTLEKLKQILPSNNFTYYLCGPPPMLAKLYKSLTSWGVPLSDIHNEAFGPASIQELHPISTESQVSYQIDYLVTDYQAQWEPRHGTILKFSEAHGINLRSGCQSGRCGICMTKLNRGEVSYITKPQVEIPLGSCLPCIAIPAESLEIEA